MERTKAIVKFFSQEPIENVMVMMKYMPERVIFLGHKDNMITKQIRDIEQFRDHKYPDVELEFIEVPKDDLDNIIGTLAGIIREYPGIRFALTGGSEMLDRAWVYFRKNGSQQAAYRSIYRKGN